MKNQEIAARFARAADVAALLGEDSFRVLAYRRVARALEELAADVEQLSADGTLQDVPGIGKSTVQRIEEYLRTGHIGEFDDAQSQVPPGVMEMIKVPTVGPKTAAALWREGGITSIEALKAAIDANTIKDVSGVGAKKLQTIRHNIEHLAASSGRVRIGTALPVALELLEFLRARPDVQAAQYCGSLRRGKETIGDVDICVSADAAQGQAIGDALTAHPLTGQVIGSGPTKTSIRTGDGLQVDVRVVGPESYGAALQYFTGSKEHNVRLRERAIKMGLKLNEWGVYKGDERIAGATEEDVYAALELAWVPPEMRADKGEVELAAEAYKAPASKTPAAAFDLVVQDDIRGDLHTHTIASDGVWTIEDLVAESKRRGYEYVAVTDHSKSQFQANGLRAERLVEHIKAIRAVAKEAAKSGMTVLAGSEVDILADGSLDYEDELLAQLDWVVASPHAALTQETDAATRRLVRACANPYVCVLGHPTGRLVPTRRGLEPDMKAVIFAAARHGVAVECNANCHRLDLRDVHLVLAREAGIPVCINTDAHAREDMNELRYGILTARRAGLKKADVLNTRPAAELLAWIKHRKEQAEW